MNQRPRTTKESALARKARVFLRLLQHGELGEILLRFRKLIVHELGRGARARSARAISSAVSAGSPYRISIEDLSRVLEAPVFLTESEATALSKCAGGTLKTSVEIGAAFGGATSVLLASLSPGARLFSIDPFVIDSMSVWKASPDECRASVTRFLAVIDREDALEAWTLLARPSYNVVKDWGQKIDLLFIDGDHHYEAVKKDFDDWLPHVRKGGTVLIHDSRRLPGTPAKEFARGWPGPTKFAAELKKSPKVELTGEADSLTIWKKR